MKIRKLWTMIRAFLTSNRKVTGSHGFRLRYWVPIAAASTVVCAFLVAAVAQNRGANIEAHPTHEHPPYWAYCDEPQTDASNARPTDHTPQHVPNSTASFTRA